MLRVLARTALASSLGAVLLTSSVSAPSPAFGASSVPARSPATDRGLDLSNMDPTCPACTDFFRYADGKYAARHPIPADRNRIGSFDTLSDERLAVLHTILDDAAAHAHEHPETDAGKLGAFYGACLDTSGRTTAGLSALRPELAKIDAVADSASLVTELASLQHLGVPVLFAFGSSPDAKHSERTIAELADGSLGLPEREYYFRGDAKSVKERADYVALVARMLALAALPDSQLAAISQPVPGAEASAAPSASAAGGSGLIAPPPGGPSPIGSPLVVPAPSAPAAATAPPSPVAAPFAVSADDTASATAILDLETRIAKAAPTRAERRDPVANYHMQTVAALAKEAPGLDWSAYFAARGSPSLASLDVDRPAFVTAVTPVLTSVPLAVWKSYLRFRLVTTYAPTLPPIVEQTSFAFYGTELRGAPKMRPQWQRCAFAAEAQVQDAVSIVFAQKAFGPEAKARALALINAVHGALRSDLTTLAWMTPATRKRAETKLSLMVKKIGYPDHPQDYTALALGAAPYSGQRLATEAFAWTTDMARIGKPTDRTRWGMASPEVNAYEDSANNEIVFPAGILGLPFFDEHADDAVNYGGIGAVMGHETTHGFDDQGRQYDERGNLSDWWKPADVVNFKARAQCIVDQFGSYSTAGSHLNGSAVQGEAIADLGGATLAFRAFEKTPEAKAGRKIGGFTPEQRFFLSFAAIWAENQREASAREQVLTDPHPPGMWRVIGTLSNMPEFQKAFHCKALDAMVRKARCHIW